MVNLRGSLLALESRRTPTCITSKETEVAPEICGLTVHRWMSWLISKENFPMTQSMAVQWTYLNHIKLTSFAVSQKSRFSIVPASPKFRASPLKAQHQILSGSSWLPRQLRLEHHLSTFKFPTATLAFQLQAVDSTLFYTTKTPQIKREKRYKSTLQQKITFHISLCVFTKEDRK